MSSCGGGGSSSGAGGSLNLTGNWVFSSSSSNPNIVGLGGTATIIQNGNTITGTITGNPVPAGIVSCSTGQSSMSGVVSGNQVTVTVINNGGTFSGTFTGDSNSLTGNGTTIFNGRFCSGSANVQVTIARI